MKWIVLITLFFIQGCFCKIQKEKLKASKFHDEDIKIYHLDNPDLDDWVDFEEIEDEHMEQKDNMDDEHEEVEDEHHDNHDDLEDDLQDLRDELYEEKDRNMDVAKCQRESNHDEDEAEQIEDQDAFKYWTQRFIQKNQFLKKKAHSDKIKSEGDKH